MTEPGGQVPAIDADVHLNFARVRVQFDRSDFPDADSRFANGGAWYDVWRFGIGDHIGDLAREPFRRVAEKENQATEDGKPGGDKQADPLTQDPFRHGDGSVVAALFPA